MKELFSNIQHIQWGTFTANINDTQWAGFSVAGLTNTTFYRSMWVDASITFNISFSSNSAPRVVANGIEELGNADIHDVRGSSVAIIEHSNDSCKVRLYMELKEHYNFPSRNVDLIAIGW